MQRATYISDEICNQVRIASGVMTLASRCLYRFCHSLAWVRFWSVCSLLFSCSRVLFLLEFVFLAVTSRTIRDCYLIRVQAYRPKICRTSDVHAVFLGLDPEIWRTCSMNPLPTRCRRCFIVIYFREICCFFCFFFWGGGGAYSFCCLPWSLDH